MNDTVTDTSIESNEKCWNCPGDQFIAGGFDEDGEAITVCKECYEVQW